MAKIKISDLRPADVDLFSDSESYMHDLTKEEMTNTSGGFGLIVILLIIFPTPAY